MLRFCTSTLTVSLVALGLNGCGIVSKSGDGQSVSETASVSLKLPEKEKLPAEAAKHLSHFRFAVYAMHYSDASSVPENDPCGKVDQTAAYSSSTVLEAKLKKECSYVVGLVLGTPDKDGKLNPAAVYGDSKSDGSKDGTVKTMIFYQGAETVHPDEMKDKSKINLTIALDKVVINDDGDTQKLPDTITLGGDIDLEVSVKFPEETTNQANQASQATQSSSPARQAPH